VVQDPSDPDNNVTQGQTRTVEGTTVQLPTFAFTSVTTTVSVPDGGTVLLGGIKRLREGRNERGVPILSKMPWVSRLFKNVGIGRDAQSLMMMVTPRIIIQEEEEQNLGLEIEQ
jgi:general secretion pathway protein D